MPPAAFAAGGIVISGTGACATEFHVRADDAPLAQVLFGLADAVGFQVVANVWLGERVTIDRHGPPDALLRQLLGVHNVVITETARADCGGRRLPSSVWIMAAGVEGERFVYEPRRNATPPLIPLPRGEGAAPPARVLPRGTRRSMSEAEWQALKNAVGEQR